MNGGYLKEYGSIQLQSLLLYNPTDALLMSAMTGSAGQLVGSINSWRLWLMPFGGLFLIFNLNFYLNYISYYAFINMRIPIFLQEILTKFYSLVDVNLATFSSQKPIPMCTSQYALPKKFVQHQRNLDFFQNTQLIILQLVVVDLLYFILSKAVICQTKNPFITVVKGWFRAALYSNCSIMFWSMHAHISFSASSSLLDTSLNE